MPSPQSPAVSLPGLRSHLLLGGIGAVSGVALTFDWWALNGRFEPPRTLDTLGLLAVVAAMGAAALFGLRTLVRWIVGQLPLPAGAGAEYAKYDTLTYAVFLLLFLGSAGFQLSIPLLYSLALSFLVAQAVLIAVLVRTWPEANRSPRSPAWPSLLFLVSGMAALIYQIVWQRVLFAAYGVNIESVTIIVSLFMFGLGIGSLVGGKLSEMLPAWSLEVFILCEAAIGSFGVASLPLIRSVTDATVNGSLLTVSATTFALLCVPTVCMGATLPVLVGFLYRHTHSVGRSVGALYCLNTLGSALASLLTVDLLFRFLGQQQTAIVAAGLNWLVAGLAFSYRRRLAGQPPLAREPAVEGESPGNPGRRYSIAYPLALVLAALIGYVSLSQEIVWVRAISFATGGMPQVFGHVLGFFLVGVALGALAAQEVCSRNRTHPLSFIAGMLAAAAVIYYFALPLTAAVIPAHFWLGVLASYVLVALVAFCLGGVLPILCHFAHRPGTPVGVSVSHVYMANILGSVAGPLVTGFLLLNAWTLEGNVLYLTVLSLVLGGAIVLGAPSGRARLSAAAAGVAFIVAAATWHDTLYGRLLERLQFDRQDRGFTFVVQNRSGIITVAPFDVGDGIFGGGVYDGGFNVSPVTDWNGITRAYMMAALHPAPEDVLEIGLSSGSWAWVLAAHPAVKHLTVVEINPGYPVVVDRYRPNRDILTDPRVRVETDDGRRWLKRHPDSRFDFILMNTTNHWRSNLTDLLSREFLELCRSHLKPGGVLYFNTTDSEDAIHTAAAVFRHITRYLGFAAASDSPFAMTADQRRTNVAKFAAGGAVILDPGDRAAELVLEKLTANDLHDWGDEFRRRTDLRIITDDNMVPEFKSTDSRIGGYYRWFNRGSTWAHFRF
jgi:spermidine synthase